jgi:predicted TIM-barrel fold metal-dependent hydrolase
MTFIDAHRHLFEEETIGEVLGQMDVHGVAHSVVLPIGGNLEFLGKHLADNAHVFAFVAPHKDRLSPGVYLDPREARALDELRRYADRGALVVKLWPPVGYFPDREEYYPLYEEIEARRLPVMIHTGLTDLRHPKPRAAMNSRFAMPMELDGLIRVFPRIVWLYAHAGNPDFATAIHHAATHANVYLNVNGMADESGWDARLFRFYERMQGACAPLPWDKLLWGTDDLGFDFGNYDRLFSLAGQTANLAAFYAENARRIYGLTS